MARIVLHIGTHKTATTTLQDTLAANRAGLAEQGVVYPDIGSTSGHHMLATHWIDLPKVYYDTLPAVEHWRALAERYAQGEETVVLSSEELSRWRPQAVDYAELAALLAPFEKRTIVCTLRNQLAYLQSIYLQITKEARGPGFDAFLDQALRTNHATGVFLDYGALYDHLLAGFDADEIAFLSYETAVRQEGGILGAILERADLPGIALEPLPAGNSNVSPEPLAAWAANQIAAPGVAGRGLVGLAREIFAETFGAEAKSTLYSRPEVERVAAHFTPLNQAFEARYRAVEPDFALAPLRIDPELVYRGQLQNPFWIRLGRRLYAGAGA